MQVLAPPIAGQAQIRRGGEKASGVHAAQHAKFAHDGAMLHARTGILACSHRCARLRMVSQDGVVWRSSGIPVGEICGRTAFKPVCVNLVVYRFLATVNALAWSCFQKFCEDQTTMRIPAENRAQ